MCNPKYDYVRLTGSSTHYTPVQTLQDSVCNVVCNKAQYSTAHIYVLILIFNQGYILCTVCRLLTVKSRRAFFLFMYGTTYYILYNISIVERIVDEQKSLQIL